MTKTEGLTQLSDEQKAKVMACKTSEEVLALARDEGYELSDDELEAVSGGWTDCNDVEERNDPNVHYADDHRAK